MSGSRLAKPSDVLDEEDGNGKFPEVSEKAEVVESMINDTIPPLSLAKIEVWVMGMTPLAVNRFDHKVEDDSKKEKEDTVSAMKRACHVMENGWHAIPEKAVRASMLKALPYLPKSVSRKAQAMNGLFHIMPPDERGDMIPLFFDQVIPLVKTGRNPHTGKSCIIKRAMYPNWGIAFFISFNRALISPENLLTIASYAGYHAGLCEMRPERRGSYGMFMPVLKEEFETKTKGMRGHLKTKDWPATV